MASMMLGDSAIEFLTPSVNAPLEILYINCVVCLSRDSYAVGSAFSVVEPISVYYYTWMIN
jgi:hypothetical protein